MPRDGAGNYNLPSGQPVVYGATIDDTIFNSLTSDLATALTASLPRDGQAPPTANLPMGNFKHTGVADGTARTHYAALGQVQDGSAHWLTSVSGGDTITATLATPGLAAYVAGLVVRFVAAAANTSAVATLNINGLGAKTIKRLNGDALEAGDLPTGGVVEATYDGTDFRIIGLANVGYLNVPQNSQSANYTLVASDAGKHILHPSADANARTFTIPANSSVPFPVGTAVTFVNETSQVVSIGITTDTLTLAGSTTTGTRSLAQNGVATALKVTSTKWIISGTGLT